MQVITVAPIVRGALQSHLTYFPKAIAVGMVVIVLYARAKYRQ